MIFSSFSKFSFIASIDSKHLPRSNNFSFENRKKLHRAISDEYGVWSITLSFGQKTFVQRWLCTMVYYCGAKSMNYPSTNLAVFSGYSRANALWRLYSISYSSLWKFVPLEEIRSVHITIIEKNCQYDLDFRTILMRFQFVFEASFC